MRTLALALAVLLLADAAAAQRHRDRSFAEQGDVALTAEIESITSGRLLPTLGGVGLRYRAGDRTVLGVSVGGVVRSDDYDQSNAGGSAMQESELTEGRVALWTEQHVGRRWRAVSPFVGAGLQLALRSRTGESVQEYAPCPPDQLCDVEVRRVRSEEDGRTVGAAVFAGAEVRLASRVTLGAAYLVGVEHTRTDGSQEHAVTGLPRSEYETETLRVGTSLTRVVLSVYL